MKIVAERDGPILGVHIVGPWATELVAEGYLAVNWEATPEDVAALDPPAPDAERAVRRGRARAHRPHAARLTAGDDEDREPRPTGASRRAVRGGPGLRGRHDAPARRDGHRGHDHALAEAGRRPVEADEPLFEVSTDKVDSEVPAPSRGVLAEIRMPEGETAASAPCSPSSREGAAAAARRRRRHRRTRRRAGAEAPTGAPARARGARRRARAAGARGRACRPRRRRRSFAAPPPAPEPAVPPPAPAPAHAAAAASAGHAGSSRHRRRARRGTRPSDDAVAAGDGGGGRSTSPVVRRLIAEHGLDPATMRGTGEGGRITRKDVLDAAAAHAARQVPAASDFEPIAAPPAPETIAPAPAPPAPVRRPRPPRPGRRPRRPARSAPAAPPRHRLRRPPVPARRPPPRRSGTPAAPAPGRARPGAAGARAGHRGRGPDGGPRHRRRAGGDEVVPFSNIRRRTAEHVVRSKATSAHVYTSVEVDFERVCRVREAAPGGVEGARGLLAHLPPVHRPCVLRHRRRVPARERERRRRQPRRAPRRPPRDRRRPRLPGSHRAGDPQRRRQAPPRHRPRDPRPRRRGPATSSCCPTRCSAARSRSRTPARTART